MAWPKTELGLVCEFQNGFAFKSKLFTESGTPILRISNIQSGSIDVSKIAYTDPNSYKEKLDRYIVEDGDLLIAMSGATTGKIGINDTGTAFLLNQRVGKFIPKNKLHKQYLYYFLSTKVEEHLRISAGAAQPNLSTDQIKALEIPLPPIPEQKRIVAILDQAFADIDRARELTERNLQNARELFESYLQQVFSQRGEEWVAVTLGQQIELITGFAFKSKEYTDASDGIPLIRGDNIVQGKLRWKGVKRWDKSRTEEFSKYALAEDDILLAMDRTWIKAGMKYAKVGKSDLPALLVQRVACLRCKQDLSPEFLFHLLGSKVFEQYVLDIQTGLGVPHISGKQIQAFQFSRPQLSEQLLIENRMSELKAQIEELNRIYEAKLTSINELKKSLLQKAFSGELSQNKTDAA